MPNEPVPGEQLDQLEALLERWQVSLDLHAKYAALDDERYWHVQPWPRHERPQRWIIQLARKRIIALRRIVEQRTTEGDRPFLEGIEIMGFLATLVGVTSFERIIPLATHETERREILAAQTDDAQRPPAARPVTAAEPARGRAPAAPARESTGRTAENRRVLEAAAARAGAERRTAETTRQMPQLAQPKAFRAAAAPRGAAPPRSAAAPAPAARRREAQRPATVKPRKAPSTITQMEHVVIADAVRLLGWGQQWHELAEKIARLAERPAPSEIRRILRTYQDHIEAIATRRRQ